ncbi:MAG TPA: (2Fe-2S)-binding protein [Candidatus Limnocylindrales bacterium]|nr:(2Fe-2S)-binding protein [Candidatus Limnocylindrales bacterium]
MRLKLEINGTPRDIEAREHESLLTVLREQAGLVGSKDACEQGECGSCSVLIDDALVCACLVMAGAAAGRTIRTVESLGTAERLHPVQRAFIDAGAVQCGFCTPGFVISTVALLAANPEPSDAEIKEALAGNICRCTGYGKILEAVHRAAGTA